MMTRAVFAGSKLKGWDDQVTSCFVNARVLLRKRRLEDCDLWRGVNAVRRRRLADGHGKGGSLSQGHRRRFRCHGQPRTFRTPLSGEHTLI